MTDAQLGRLIRAACALSYPDEETAQRMLRKLLEALNKAQTKPP